MVDDEKEIQQEYLKAFNNYFPRYDRESGCIKKAKEDLEKIKKTTNLEKKLQEVDFAWSWHNNNEIHVSGLYNGGNLHELVSHSNTIEKYRKLIKELWNLRIETSEKVKQKKCVQKITKSKPTHQSNQQPQNQAESVQEYCQECTKLINPETEHLVGFCSEQCYLKHHGSFCSHCDKYHLVTYYWDQEKYPDLTYCLDCYEEEKLQNEQANAEQKETSSSKLDFDSDKHIKGIVEGMKKSIEEQNKKRQLEASNRERERESIPLCSK